MRTDEELMQAYVGGDATAFRTLFNRYAPVLKRVFLRRLRTKELARDLVQQTFLQFHRARHDFRPDATVRPWLMTIALNLVREHYRKSVLHLEAPMSEVHEPRESARGQERSDGRRDLARALDRISENQREVIVLHWLEGLPFSEISEVMGASPVAVRVLAHRGYMALREFFENDGNGSLASDIDRIDPRAGTANKHATRCSAESDYPAPRRRSTSRTVLVAPASRTMSLACSSPT